MLSSESANNNRSYRVSEKIKWTIVYKLLSKVSDPEGVKKCQLLFLLSLFCEDVLWNKILFFTTVVKSWSDYFISLKYCFLMNKSPYKNEGRGKNLYILIPNLTVQKYILGGPRMGSIPMCGRKIERSPENWSCGKLHRYHHLPCLSPRCTGIIQKANFNIRAHPTHIFS